MTNNLDSLRQKIDEVDDQILELLAQRMQLVQKVGLFKKQHGIMPLDKKRWQKVMASKLMLAHKLKLDKKMVEDVYRLIHKTALKAESLIQGNKKL